jgi:hypothetical protein
MADLLAIAAAAAWLLAFGCCALVTRRPALRAGTADLGPGLHLDKPALVNVAATRCRLNGAAYAATILDLAAAGHLAVAEREPGQLWCEVPLSPPAQAGLARSEELVLVGARALASGDGAPFEALAESCASDIHGRWDPFERAVRAEARRAGITRPRLAAATRVLLYAGAGCVAALVFAAIDGGSHSGLWAPAVTAFFAFAVPAYWVHSLGRRDRLTARGSALGALAVGAAADVTAAAWTPGLASALSSAELSRLARAVAAGAPVHVFGATPGLATGVRPGRGRARTGISGQSAGTARPSAAWSSFGGQWRLVRIGPASSASTHPAFWLVLAAWLGLMAYAGSLLPGPAGGLVTAVLAVGSAAAALGGARGLAAWLARPAETSFQAQVIARWVENSSTNDDDTSIACVAVDDGERSWSFDVSGKSFGQLALGDTVTVRASPRSGKLLGVVPTQLGTGGGAAAPDRAAVNGHDESRPGEPADDESRRGEPVRGEGRPAAAAAGQQAGATPRAALLAAGEVSAAVGRPVRAAALTTRATSTVYRGEGVTVIVTVADGFLGSLASLARRRGHPLPGVGDEAWLLNRDRTVVLRAGGRTAKVTLGGSAARSLPPDVVTRLAASVAERLPDHATSPGMQA